MRITRFTAFVKRIAARNTVVLTTLQALRRWARRAVYLCYCALYRTDPHLIVLESYYGMSYACNPKALYEAMQRDSRWDDYRFVWSFQEPHRSHDRPTGARTTVVTHDSHAYKKAMARAKYYISNSFAPNYIYFKKGQVYVQTWHGTPLKRLGCDIEVDGNRVNTVREIHRRYARRSARFDYMISPSRFCTEKLRSAFALETHGKGSIVRETGYPRNDFLFRFTKQDCDAVRQRLHIPDSKKVLLYAPTFRDNQTRGDVFTYRPALDFRSLCDALGNDWIVLFRAHYLVAEQFDFSAHGGHVIDASGVDDINELYIISDLLVTDYSSVFFDYANLHRPFLFFMYDLDEYRDSIRNFYLDPVELPAPIVQTQTELEQAIVPLITQFAYDDTYRRFNEKFNPLDDANSAGRVLDILISENFEKGESSC